MIYRIVRLDGLEIYRIEYWYKPWWGKARWLQYRESRVIGGVDPCMYWEIPEFDTVSDAAEALVRIKARENEQTHRRNKNWQEV